MNQITKEFIEEQNLKLGKTLKEICAEFNISYGVILYNVKKYGIKIKRGIAHNAKDLSKQKFGKLQPIIRVGRRGKSAIWECKCDCGTVKNLLAKTLCCGRTNSCGCVAKNKLSTEYWNYSGYKELSGHHFYTIRIGAETRGLEFNISKEYIYNLFIAQGGKCALSGVDITLKRAKTKSDKTSRTASLDRIDSSKGYTEDNVQWVHITINQMKWDLSQSGFINWCHIIADMNPVDRTANSHIQSHSDS